MIKNNIAVHVICRSRRILVQRNFIEELKMNIVNEHVRELIAEIPEGHRHIRTRIILQDNTEIIFQEATIANIVRAYVTLKTHPQKVSLKLMGKRLADRKSGFAEWQLLEEE